MLSSFLGVLPILIPPLCALALSCDQSPRINLEGNTHVQESNMSQLPV
jgi:hypothetical protein